MQKNRKCQHRRRWLTLFLLCPLLLTAFSACYSGGPELPLCEAVSPPSKYPEFQVVNGMAYLYSSFSSSFYALRVSDGAVQWKYHISGTIVIDKVIDGVVYTEIQQSGSQIVIYALRAQNGTMLWKKNGDDLQLIEVSDGIAYIFTGSDQQLIALQADTGDLLWQHPMTDPPAQPGKGPPTSTTITGLFAFTENNGIVYNLSFGGYLTALWSLNGTFLWQDHIDAPAGFFFQYNHLSVENNILYVQTDRVYAIQANTGKLLWQFYNAPHDPGNDVRVSNNTGKLLWQFYSSLPPFDSKISSMIVTSAAVYVLDGHVYALQSENGKLLWQFPSPSLTTLPAFFRIVSFSRFMLLNGVIYAGWPGISPNIFEVSQEVLIPAIRASDGKLLWYYQTPLSPNAIRNYSLASSGNETYFLKYQIPNTPLNTLEARSVSNGKLLWQRNLHDVLLLTDNGSLYASAAGTTGSDCYPAARSYVDKLSPIDGTPIWHFEAGDVTGPSL